MKTDVLQISASWMYMCFCGGGDRGVGDPSWFSGQFTSFFGVLFCWSTFMRLAFRFWKPGYHLCVFLHTLEGWTNASWMTQIQIKPRQIIQSWSYLWRIFCHRPNSSTTNCDVGGSPMVCSCFVGCLTLTSSWRISLSGISAWLIRTLPSSLGETKTSIKNLLSGNKFPSIHMRIEGYKKKVWLLKRNDISKN